MFRKLISTQLNGWEEKAHLIFQKTNAKPKKPAQAKSSEEKLKMSALKCETKHNIDLVIETQQRPFVHMVLRIWRSKMILFRCWLIFWVSHLTSGESSMPFVLSHSLVSEPNRLCEFLLIHRLTFVFPYPLSTPYPLFKAVMCENRECN